MKENIEELRKSIEQAYHSQQFGFKGGFGEILCYELHSQPVNPRMHCKTGNDGNETGLSFKELAAKWGISLSRLGQLIADHCEKL